jgi:D-hexose-6-phosphate mutarotase
MYIANSQMNIEFNVLENICWDRTAYDKQENSSFQFEWALHKYVSHIVLDLLEVVVCHCKTETIVRKLKGSIF